MIIAVDFDGTLHTGTWPEIGLPKAYAVHAMQSLKEAGHYLIIWTCREGEAQTRAVNWLLENGIPFDRINDHHPANVAKYGGDARKVWADLYIDDKNLGGLPDWDEILNIVNDHK